MLASIPTAPDMVGKDFGANSWREETAASDQAFVSSVHPRLSDNRLVTDIVAAVRAPEGTLLGFVGDSVLVERIGRRLSAIEFSDRFLFEVLDQNGAALFANDFKPNPGATSAESGELVKEIRQNNSGTFRVPRTTSIPSVVLNPLVGWQLWSNRHRWLTNRFTTFLGE